MELRYLLKTLLLPPFSHIVLLFGAVVLHKSKPRLARVLIVVFLLSLWGLSTPVVANFLALSQIQDPAISPAKLAHLQADAIVILSASQNENALEFGQPVTEQIGLVRLRYGAYLHRKTGLPVLLTGGSVFGDEKRSLAETMAFDLAEGFGVQAQWLEKKSRTTAENATLSYAMLAKEDKTTIVLVTSALHMRRAKWSFTQAGFEVIPAPTDWIEVKPLSTRSFLPNAHSLRLSSDALHEWLGDLVYRN
ncbi:MAG: hypothetical protein CSB34_00585 [Desulfobulbus propionicus]|nr:MAG: hypothetical protein CSB34_00585 [Desulfobulbus propionicus]